MPITSPNLREVSKLDARATPDLLSDSPLSSPRHISTTFAWLETAPIHHWVSCYNFSPLTNKTTRFSPLGLLHQSRENKLSFSCQIWQYWPIFQSLHTKLQTVTTHTGGLGLMKPTGQLHLQEAEIKSWKWHCCSWIRGLSTGLTLSLRYSE